MVQNIGAFLEASATFRYSGSNLLMRSVKAQQGRPKALQASLLVRVKKVG
jgi:hypothetical protein